MTSQRLLWTLLIASLCSAPASAQNLSGLEIMERVEESEAQHPCLEKPRIGTQSSHFWEALRVARPKVGVPVG